MKHFRNPILVCAMIWVFVAVMIGCGSSTTNTTAAAVNGTWSGNYLTTYSVSGHSSYSGSLVLALSQTGTTNLIGNASGTMTGTLNGTATTSSFSGTPVTGTINGLNVSLTVLFGAVNENAVLTGTVSSNTTNMVGTWKGDFSQTGSDTCSGTWQCQLTSTATTTPTSR
jgi:hypothetical protein